MMLGRYEFSEGKSNKFWNIEECEDGYGYQVTYGRIGTSGKKQDRVLGSDEANKKVCEKISKGYKLKSSSDVNFDEAVDEYAFGKGKKEVKVGKKEAFSALLELGGSEDDVKASLERIQTAKKNAASPYPIKKKEVTETKTKLPESKEIGVMPPSRCEAKIPTDLTKKHLIAEEKLDGSRYVLYANCNPYGDRNSYNNTAFLSRRSSSDEKFIDKSSNVPHVTGHSWDELGLTGTVLDGEIYAGRGEFLQVNSIMNSGSTRAVQKQEDEGELTYVVFDIMAYRGRDLRGRPWTERRKILEHVVQMIDCEFIQAVGYVANVDGDSFIEVFKETVETDGEGLIIKDTRSGYGIGWAKMKKSYDVSCIITGMKAGNGRNASTFGALALSVYDDESGKLVEVGFVSIQEDKVRQKVFDNFHEYEGTVIDVFAQEIQKKSKTNPCGRLRHTSFYRFRDDIDSSSITSAKLDEDLKSRPKFGRRTA